MKVYQVFKHPERGYRAVKRGFSWPGFFFSAVWALSRRLWLEAGWLVILLSVVTVLSLGIRWTSQPFCYALGLLYAWYAGARGNFWRARNFEEHGYVLLGTINARDIQDATAKAAAVGNAIPEEMKAAPPQGGLLSVPRSLQAIVAIVVLTWKAAFRYRLFWVIMALLLGAVVGLPLLLKHDGTAEGFAQILITYTLCAVTTLLGLCTLWLACGTLARDVEDCQIQMVVVKPVARWQIWLGKWVGLVLLNAALLTIVGVCLYSFLQLRSRGLSDFERARLQDNVLVARASAREAGLDKFISDETEKRLQEQLAQGSKIDPNLLRKTIGDQVKAEQQSVSPNHGRRWIIHLGIKRDQLKGQPLFLRTKFNVAEGRRSETFAANWSVADPSGKGAVWICSPMSLTADSYHEFAVPSQAMGENGDLEITYANANSTTVFFPLDDGMEVLYREGGFALNLVRGMGIILCWMALLAALGLAAASFLSFPVAAFCALSFLGLGFSSGSLADAISGGSIFGFDDTGVDRSRYLDVVIIPVFRGLLWILNLAEQFSPVDSLSTGRSIRWSELGMAVAVIVLIMGGLLAVSGIFLFNKRELATAQAVH